MALKINTNVRHFRGTDCGDWYTNGTEKERTLPNYFFGEENKFLLNLHGHHKHRSYLGWVSTTSYSWYRIHIWLQPCRGPECGCPQVDFEI